MMKNIKLLFVGMAILLSTSIFADNSPISMLENTSNQIIDTLKKNKSALILTRIE